MGTQTSAEFPRLGSNTPQRWGILLECKCHLAEHLQCNHIIELTLVWESGPLTAAKTLWSVIWKNHGKTCHQFYGMPENVKDLILETQIYCGTECVATSNGTA